MFENLTRLSIINTNSRSLSPKIDSLIDCMEETDAHVAVVTESWFKDGTELEDLRDRLLSGSGIGMLCRNRNPNPNGVAYGGVTLLWQAAKIDFKQVTIKNQDGFELLVAARSVTGQRRKLVILGCYFPPNYTKQRGQAALDFVEDVVVDMKRKFHDILSSL